MKYPITIAISVQNKVLEYHDVKSYAIDSTYNTEIKHMWVIWNTVLMFWNDKTSHYNCRETPNIINKHGISKQSNDYQIYICSDICVV